MIQACGVCGVAHPIGTRCLALRLADDLGPGELAAGTLLAGRYAIVRTIQWGGMSAVYLAGDRLRQGLPVVLKELHVPGEAAAAERREAEAWFARESYLLSSLRHPLIPEFYSVFAEGGRSYIVQEYVAGENLEQVLARRGPLDEAPAIAWGVALCELLTYLHERDEPVVFRDLKPANILWDKEGAGGAGAGRLAVVDFGIARPFRQGEVGTVIGTPGYAPPEQYQGLTTPRSDIYALGATLHRLVSGYDPAQGPPFTFPPLERCAPHVSGPFAAAVGRALQLDPAARFGSARELGDALRAAGREHAGLPVGAAAAAAIRAPGRQPAGRPGGWVVPALGAALVAPLLLSMVAGLLARATEPASPAPAYVWVYGGQIYDPNAPSSMPGQDGSAGAGGGFGQPAPGFVPDQGDAAGSGGGRPAFGPAGSGGWGAGRGWPAHRDGHGGWRDAR